MYFTLFYFNIGILGLCLLASLIPFFRKDAPTFLRYFFLLVSCTLTAKFLGHKLAIDVGNNHIVYNFFSVVTIDFYLFLLRIFIQNRNVKSFILFWICLFSVCSLLNIFFLQGLNNFHTITYGFGAMLVVGCCVYYLQELFFAANPPTNLRYNSVFWVVMGLLFFYGATFIGLTATHLMVGLPEHFLNIMTFFLMISDQMLYVVFTISLVCLLIKPKVEKESI